MSDIKTVVLDGSELKVEDLNGQNTVIMNRSGITIRLRMADIRVMGRATQGVRVINLEKRGDTIASVCTVDTDPEEEVEIPDNDVEQNADADTTVQEENQ